MKRLALQELIKWKNSSNRKPLIIKGARQVGKTYLLKLFAEQEFPQHFYINFEKQPGLAKLFTENLDPKRIINELSFTFKKQINPQTDLLIFDEIQACPKALTALKYFCEDLPELALCAAGSLLGIHLNSEPFPVGKVDWLHLYPMSFKEFLIALEETLLVELLDKMSLNISIPDIAHEQLWQHLKYYFIVGGLPEVISLFCEHKNTLFDAFTVVRHKQNNLIKDYYSDIAKHSGKVNTMQIDRVWQDVPNQLARAQDGSAPKFKFKGIISGIDRYTRLANVIDWLLNAGLIIKISTVSTCRQPLKAYTKESQFKLFLFDVGLLGCMSDLAPETILQYDYGSYKGYFAENFVCQELLCADSKLLYGWQEQQAEIEFLKEINGNLIPIEVKSGTVTHAKSLSVFIKKYAPAYSIILSAQKKMISKKRQVYYLPLYLAAELWHI